jgi:hypothetical protein
VRQAVRASGNQHGNRDNLVSIFLGNGDGTFQLKSRYTTRADFAVVPIGTLPTSMPAQRSIIAWLGWVADGSCGSSRDSPSPDPRVCSWVRRIGEWGVSSTMGGSRIGSYIPLCAMGLWRFRARDHRNPVVHHSGGADSMILIRVTPERDEVSSASTGVSTRATAEN